MGTRRRRGGGLAAAVVAWACVASGPRDAGHEPSSAAPAPPRSGSPAPVEVRLGAASFATGEIVRFEIGNGLGRSVFTEDQKSACSIAWLERARGDGWEPIVGCNLERLPTVIEIGPGESRPSSIDPSSTHFGVPPGSRTPGFGAGRYRLRFTYRLGRGPEGEETETAHSPAFRIGP